MLTCRHAAGLKEAGFHSVHIMAHSMGVRVVLAAMQRLHFSVLFLPPYFACHLSVHLVHNSAGDISHCCAGMLLGLKEAGFHSVHIMAHSMGVRVVLAAVQRLHAVFTKPKPPGRPDNSSSQQAGHANVDAADAKVSHTNEGIVS